MNYDDMISVLQAAKDGKVIESRSRNVGTPWIEATTPCWDFNRYDYRVKPEPLKALPDPSGKPYFCVAQMNDTGRVTVAWRSASCPGHYDAPSVNGKWMLYCANKLRELSRAECEAAGYAWPIEESKP